MYSTFVTPLSLPPSRCSETVRSRRRRREPFTISRNTRKNLLLSASASPGGQGGLNNASEDFAQYSAPDSPRPPESVVSDDVSVSTAVSSAKTLNAALADVASRSLANLSPGGSPNLAIVFVSVRYSFANVGSSGRHSMDLVVPRLRALIPTLTAVVGCTADGVIGAASTGDVVEIDNGPAVSLTLMRLPGITITPFHVMPDDLPSPDAPPEAWRSLITKSLPASVLPTAFMVFADPAFADRGGLRRFLSGVEYAYPESSAVGALASAAATFPNGHMFCTLPRDILSPEATSLRDSGLVGISLSGDVELDCLVSPGCRPIGPEFEVRKVAPNNVVLEMELVGRPSSCLPATSHLKSVVSYATPTERKLLQEFLYMGVSISGPENGEEGYLIQHVLGVDLYGGTISLAQGVRVGQRVKFFVLDDETAIEAMDQTMQKYKRVELANSLVGYSNPPFGAMVFVDAGRGRGLFKQGNMETRNLTSFAPGVPVAGCFSGGQIGPCRTGGEGRSGASVTHVAGNLVALIRRRSGMMPSEDLDSPPLSPEFNSDK